MLHILYAKVKPVLNRLLREETHKCFPAAAPLPAAEPVGPAAPLPAAEPVGPAAPPPAGAACGRALYPACPCLFGGLLPVKLSFWGGLLSKKPLFFEKLANLLEKGFPL